MVDAFMCYDVTRLTHRGKYLSCICRMGRHFTTEFGNRLLPAIGLTFISDGTYNPLLAGCNILIQREKWLNSPTSTNLAGLGWSTSVPRSRLNG